MKSVVSRLLRLTFSEQYLLLKIWFLLLKWHMLISCTPFKYWKNHLSEVKPKLCSSKYSVKSVNTIVDLTETAARHHIKHMNCIRRSMVLRDVLLQNGYNAHLQFGIKIQNQALKAHAWVNLEGKPINDTRENISHYQPISMTELNEKLMFNL